MDVPVREEGAADDEVIIFTQVNETFSILFEVNYSMLFHDSFSVLFVSSYAYIKVSKQEEDVVLWNVVNCHLQ